MDNYKKAYANFALYQIAYILFSGSIMQGFLLNSGVSSTDIYSYESAVTTISFIVLVASLFFADRIKNAKRVMTVIPIFIIPVFIVMGFASFQGAENKFFLPLFFCASLAYVFVGLNNTISYKLPYELIDMNNYGVFTGVSGIIAGMSTVAVSLLYSYMVSKFDFFTVHGSFSVFAIICLLFASYFMGSCKRIGKMAEKEEIKRSGAAIFKNSQMWFLLIPNIFRGISAGIINLIAVVAVTSEIITSEDVSKTVIVAQLAFFAANFIFVKLLQKLKVQTVLIAAGVIMCILLPFWVKTVGIVSFLVIYFFVRFFMILVDSSIPVCVIKFVPYSQVGAFSSIRMMAMTCGTAIAPIMLGILEKQTSYFVIFIIAAAMKMLCCLAYAYVTQKAEIMNNMRRRKNVES